MVRTDGQYNAFGLDSFLVRILLHINVTSSLALVEYQPVHPICQAVVMLNVVAGYLLLGIGIGMVGRMMRTH